MLARGRGVTGVAMVWGVLCVALLGAAPSSQELAAHDKYWEHYDLGFTGGAGLNFGFRADPWIEPLGLRLHYENRSFGRWIFQGLYLDAIFPDPDISEGYVGSLHALWETNLWDGRIGGGVGLGDRLRAVRDGAVRGNAWTLAIGPMAELTMPVSQNWVLDVHTDWAVSGLGSASFEKALDGSKPHLGQSELAFHELRLRMEAQWGAVLSLGVLYERVYPFESQAKLPANYADFDYPNDKQLTVFAGFRQPAIYGLVEVIGGLFGWHPSSSTALASDASTEPRVEPAADPNAWHESTPEEIAAARAKQDAVRALPDFLIAFNLLVGGALPMSSSSETAFANDQARAITGTPDARVERVTTSLRPTFGAGLTYFSPHQFYVGANAFVAGGMGGTDTRYVFQSGRQERALDVRKFSFGGGLRGGYYLPLFSGALAYGGVAAGPALIRFDAKSRTCSSDPEHAFDSSCATGEPVYGNNGSLAFYVQPHVGLSYTLTGVSADVEDPGSEGKVAVGGGFNLFVQVQWNQLLRDGVVDKNNQPVKTSAGDQVTHSTNGLAFFGGIGWHFAIGGDQ